MKSVHPLFVIGHRNPDTDTICSAIAYAHLKNDFLGEAAVPFRAGNLNPQTTFVLSHFGVESPELLTDVYPKIADIMVPKQELVILREADTLCDARDTMIENRFSFLPVVDDEGKSAGQITAFRLAGLTGDIADICQQERICIDLVKFVKSVGGQILTSIPTPTMFEGRLIVEGLFGDHGRESLFAFVTRYDETAIAEAIKEGAKVTIVCGQEDVGETAIELARENGVCLIVSPRDVLSTVLYIFLAMPIRDFIDRQHPTFKHHDLVRDVQRKIGKSNEGGFIVLDDDDSIEGVITRTNFLTQSKFRIVLVDHNEFSQSVDGIYEADVVEIIDHHRLGNRSTDAPITFINKVVGATATIIAELYKNYGFTPDPRIAGLLLSAILSDTVILKSPTTTRLDKDMSIWLASIAKLDVRGFGEEMFAAGSVLDDVEPERLIEQDAKIFVEGEIKFSISQIEIVGFEQFYEIKSALEKGLVKILDQEGCNFSCLMVTDITRETSLFLCTGEKKIINAITYPRVEENIFEMKDVLSRKTQVLPYLLDLVRRL